MKKIVFLSLVLLVACQSSHTKKTKLKSPEISFKKDGVLKIYDSLGQSKAVFDIEIADTDYKRETGLMYRKKMDVKQAMFFVFETEKPRYFYMKNTYIPLDIIFISKDSIIVSIANNAKALDETTLPSGYPAQYVLEIKAGLSYQKNIQKGDKLKWKLINRD